jgi:hypothetical protein
MTAAIRECGSAYSTSMCASRAASMKASLAISGGTSPLVARRDMHQTLVAAPGFIPANHCVVRPSASENVGRHLDDDGGAFQRAVGDMHDT